MLPRYEGTMSRALTVNDGAEPSLSPSVGGEARLNVLDPRRQKHRLQGTANASVGSD